MALGRVQYNVAYKHHSFGHLASQCEVLNPRFVSTYTEESMMATGTRLYKALCNGPYEHVVQRQVLSKYVTALELLLSGVL